jgi:hypothetical protein
VTRLAVAAYAAVLVGLALLTGPLGHDEAQYAIGGAALLGRAASAFPLHRPVGMQLVAAPGVLAGGDDLGFHLIAVVTTLAMIAAVYIYVRRAHGAGTAGWATAVVATSFAVVRRGAELLPDAPAAVFVLTFAAILIGGLGPNADPARRWRLAWLGPLAAAAFYLRYGSIGVLGSLSASALVVWWRQLRANAAPLAVAVGSAAALAVPHVLHSVDATGSALGILRQASFAAGRGYTGDGLVFYGTTWWLWLGPIAAVCASAGLIAAVARRDAVTAFAGLAAFVAIVVLGLDAHGEARFVLVPEVLLVGAGVDAIRAWAMPRPRAAAIGLAATLAGSTVAAAVGLVRARHTFDVAVDAAHEVRRAAGGAPCAVIAGKWTQAEWYSGCAGAQPPDTIAPDAVRGRPTFLVWFDDGVRQPPSLLEDVRTGRTGVRATEVAHVDGGAGAWGGARVFRLQAVP